MCVILHIKPGAKIPYSKLECAAEINKDGWGAAFIHKNRLVAERSTDKNDPKVIADFLQKYKDKHLHVHLRHATVGDVSMKNCHPFVVCSKDEGDPLDIMMMHNGTFMDYKPAGTAEDKTFSDTWIFNEWVMRPLLKRFAKAMKPKEIVYDNLVSDIMDKCGGVSVVSIFDNYGQCYTLNAGRGKDFEGWWASNEYSFQTNHVRHSNFRSSSQAWENNHGGGTHSHGGSRYLAQQGRFQSSASQTMPWEQSPPEDTPVERWERLSKKLSGDNDDTFDPWDMGDQDPNFQDYDNGLGPLIYEMAELRKLVQTQQPNESSIMKDGVLNVNLLARRTPFLGEAGFGKLEDICKLNRRQIEEACENFPKGMAQAFIDIIALQFPNAYGQNPNRSRLLIEGPKEQKSSLMPESDDVGVETLAKHIQAARHDNAGS